MKRWGLSAALVASLGMSAGVASAQRVTLKPAPEKTSVEKVASPKREAEKETEKEPAEKPTPRKTSTAKPNADSGILTPPPTSPLKPRTPKELDAKYPVVPDALRMTLEELIPTKELRNVRVLKAMARIPRAEFVTKEFREYAYH